MANRSKRTVNWLPGSAQGMGSCLTPWVGHSIRGTSASIQVVNWQVSRCRQRRGFWSYPGTVAWHAGQGNGPSPACTRTVTCWPFTSSVTSTTVHGGVRPRIVL
jgi:hypothetical protein